MLHQLMKEKTFQCHICDAKFTREPTLNRNMASIPEGKMPFKCERCAACFARKQNLRLFMMERSFSNVTFVMLALHKSPI